MAIDTLDLTPHRVVIGDTTAFITKLNAMQSDLETWSSQANAETVIIDGVITDSQALLVQMQGLIDEAIAIVGGDYLTTVSANLQFAAVNEAIDASNQLLSKSKLHYLNNT